MHSEAKTTWSNSFERPRLSNGQCIFLFFFFGDFFLGGPGVVPSLAV